MNALVYVNIDWGIHEVKLKNALNEKQKKTTWVFFFYKYGKFWSISWEQKVELKPLFSLEWYGTQCELHFINEKYAQFPKGILVATHISCWITYIERPCPHIQCDVYCIQNAIEVNSWYPARILSLHQSGLW